MNKKKIVYIDMDGVLVDLKSNFDAGQISTIQTSQKPFTLQGYEWDEDGQFIWTEA